MAFRTVEFWTAFGWTCDDCGLDNFERGAPVPMSDEEREEMAAYHGVPKDTFSGEMYGVPESVTCKHCGADFDVEEPGSPESDLD